MDIDLLAGMVRDLVLEHDEVALPGVGTFVAEFVGASFSEKGFVVNPPYRRLAFRQREGDGDLLVSFYAQSNGLEKDRARKVLVDFLSEMREVLKQRKVIVFPGLGRLRATKENLFFFVPDEGLNIYPEGFGLEAVSLKRHGDEDAPDGRDVQSAVSSPSWNADFTSSAAPSQAGRDVREAESTPSGNASLTPSAVPDAPSTEHSVAPAAETKPRRRLPAAVRAAIIVAAVAVVFLAALAILGRVAPDFVDKLLYTPAERELLRLEIPNL